MEPINYTAGAQNPMQAFQGALNMGLDMRNNLAVVAKNEAAAVAAEVEAKRQADVAALFEKLKQPGATAKDYMDLAMTLPEKESAAVINSFKALKEEERQATLIDTSKVFSAFKAGRVDLAVQLIRAQATAERNAGNEQGAALAEEWAKMAESSPDGAKAVETMLGFTIANLPGGDKAIEGVTKFEQGIRDAKLFPVLMAQKEAELRKADTDEKKAAIELKYKPILDKAVADKAVADAGVAQLTLNALPALQAAALSTAQSGAETAAINLEFARRKAAAEAIILENDATKGTIELKTLDDLLAEKLKTAKAGTTKAEVDAEYASPVAQANLLLSQLQAQGLQIDLKSVEALRKAQLDKAVGDAAKAKVEAEFAPLLAAATLLDAQGKATITIANAEVAPALAQAGLATAEAGATIAQANAAVAPELAAATLSEIQGRAKALGITNLTLGEFKKVELDKLKDDAAYAAAKAKFADPLFNAELLLAQGKVTELTTILLTLAEEKKLALSTAKSKDTTAAVEAEFALRTNQVILDQALADVGLTMEQTDKVKIDKAIAITKEARDVASFPNEQARLAFEVRTAGANAEIAEINAKYAGQIKLAELEQMAKDLGLTEAQTNKTIIEGKKISTDMTKLLMEIESLKKTGGVPPDKLFEFEDKIRKEYVARTVQVSELQQMFDKIASSAQSDTPAGDVAMVFAFMRMLDPTSVVRESEFAVAQDTTGLYGKLSLLYPKIKSGTRLTEGQRKEFTELSKQYMEASLKHEERVKKDLGVVVKNYGLNPANVFGVGSPDTPPATTTEVDY